jgi:hypothetical protein
MWKKFATTHLFPKVNHLLQIKLPWGHLIAGYFKDKKSIVEDAHDENQKNMGFVAV